MVKLSWGNGTICSSGNLEGVRNSMLQPGLASEFWDGALATLCGAALSVGAVDGRSGRDCSPLGCSFAHGLGFEVFGTGIAVEPDDPLTSSRKAEVAGRKGRG